MTPISFMALVALAGPPVDTDIDSDIDASALTAQDTVLSGRRASASFAFEAPARTRAGASTLVALDLAASEIIDPKRSSLTVSVDGRPVRTAWVADIVEPARGGSLVADLGTVSEGHHVATVSARLRVDGDPCLDEHAEGAWVTVTTQSTLRHEAVAEDVGGSLADLPADWRGRGGGTVQVRPPQAMSPDTVLATVEAVQRLQGWDLSSTLDDGSESNGPALVLASLDDDAVDAALTRRLRAAPRRARALAQRDGMTLTVVGRTAADLPVAMAQLASQRTRSLCPARGPCLLSDSVAEQTAVAEAATDDAVALSVADLGYAQGWTAEGPGRHTLRFVWPRPASWTIEHRPKLVLAATASEHPQLDRGATSVTAKLNGRPLSTWQMPANTAAGTLEVMIPPDAWQDEAWVFEIVVHLRPDDTTPCAALDDEAIWLNLAPDSALVVERQEPRYDGIAGYYRDAAAVRPELSWSSPRDWTEVVVLAGVLAPLATQSPNARWRWVDGQTAAGTPIVAFGPRGGSAQLVRTHSRNADWWLDAAGRQGLPLVDAGAAVLVSHDIDRGHPRLSVAVGSAVDPSQVVAPPFAALRGHDALHHEGLWVSLSQDAEPLTTKVVRRMAPQADDAVAAAAVVPSERERAFRRLNLAWLLGAGIILLGTLLAMRRRDRGATVDAGNLETMRADEGGAA